MMEQGTDGMYALGRLLKMLCLVALIELRAPPAGKAARVVLLSLG